MPILNLTEGDAGDLFGIKKRWREDGQWTVVPFHHKIAKRDLVVPSFTIRKGEPIPDELWKARQWGLDYITSAYGSPQRAAWGFLRRLWIHG